MNFSSIDDDDSNISINYKIIILGMSSSGKTKLLTRYLFGTYNDQGISSQAVDCSFVKRGNIRYGYYDTAGQEQYRSILNMYFRGTDAALLIFSLDSFKSFQELDFYYQKIQEEAPDSYIYLIGCKSDLKHVITEEQVKKKYAHLTYFETSAKINKNISQAFHLIEKELLKKKKVKRNSFILPPQSKIKPKDASTKEACCK